MSMTAESSTFLSETLGSGHRASTKPTSIHTMTSTLLQNSSDASKTPEYVMSDTDIAYVIVVMVTSVLSSLGCLIIICVHAAYSSLRTTGRAMLVQLSVADLLTAVGNLMGVLWYLFKDAPILHRSPAYCETHSALTIFSSIASFLWTLAIGFSLYLAIVHNHPHTASKFWNAIWLVCWGIPTVVTVAALASRVLGYDPNLHQASWCWIDPHAELHVMWNFLTGKAWELAAYFLTIVIYSIVRVTILRHQTRTDILERHSRQNNLSDANTKLLFVPLVFIVLRLWGTVRFLMGLIDHIYASSPEASWIVPLQGIGDTAQGIGNFVMDFFLTRAVRRRLLRCCHDESNAHAENLSDHKRSAFYGTSMVISPRSMKARTAPECPQGSACPHDSTEVNTWAQGADNANTLYFISLTSQRAE